MLVGPRALGTSAALRCHILLTLAAVAGAARIGAPPRRVVVSAVGGLLLAPTLKSTRLQAATPPPRPFLVTGASSGIGRASTQLLSAQGSSVLCAARTAEAAQGAAASGALPAGYGLALSAGLELSDLASVKAYAARLYDELPNGVEGALLCAGVEALPLRRTPQGLETTFAVNCLSHFVLAAELAARAAKEQRSLRLVSVTSSAAFDSRLADRDRLDLNWEARAFDSRQAYVDSKAVNVLIADELQRRAGAHTGILACSADPGPTASMLLRNALPQRAAQRATMDDEQLARQARMLKLRTPAEAARGLVWCLTDDACVPGALYLGAAAPAAAPPPLPTWEQPLPWRNPTLAAGVWRECASLADEWLSPLARRFVAS